MTIDLVKFALVGGEVSPSYYGRADLSKHDVSLAIAENWFVDYHGGISTSPGFEFLDFIMHDEFPVKIYPFKYSSTIENTNIIMMGKGYIRFVQDKAYVLEENKTIVSITKANTGVMEITNHGFITDDWIKFTAIGQMTELAGYTVRLTKLTDNTFELRDVYGNAINTTSFTTYVSGGTAARVYTVESPYQAEHIEELYWNQIRDVIRLTHPLYKPKSLIRNDSADWVLENVNFSSVLVQPSGFSSSVMNASNSSVAFVVTQVNAAGEESLASDYHFLNQAVTDYVNTSSGGVILRWDSITGAVYYKVYRTRIQRSGYGMNRSHQVGYIGQTRGAHFVDAGITPDFSLTPPNGNNPFANGSIISVDVLNVGSNYTQSAQITVSDPNPLAGGFIGYLINSPTDAADASPIAGVYVVDGGHDYTDPTFTITTGTGGLLEAVLSPISGNNPAVSAVHQQRQDYAATPNAPLTVFGSRPGKLSNFTTSDVILANDSFEHEIDSQNFSPLRHLIPTRGGLLAMSIDRIWLMSGTNGASITAVDVQADPQSGNGVSALPPVKVNTDIIYTEGEGGKVMMLSYNDVIKLYAGVDLSLLASHLITENKQIKAWTYAHEPFKMIHAVRTDGVMLNFTIIKEQEVFAFTRRTTQGEFLDVASILSGNESDVYVVTRRYINGRHSKFLEFATHRNFVHVEDAFCVDCGLSLSVNYPESYMQLAASTGSGIEVVCTDPVFALGDVGKVLRFGRGMGTVASYVNARSITIDILRDITELVKFTETATPKRAAPGEWSLDAKTLTVRGMQHLEGMAVSVLADGNVIEGLSVENGTITLPQAASRVVIGLSYECVMQNLPLNVPNAVLENKKKRVTALSVRVKDTRGLLIGNDMRDLYKMKERTTEKYGQPTELQDGLKQHLVEPIWSEEATSFIVQREPLPATVLGYILEVEVGDDPD